MTLTTAEFIKRAREVHGDKYDYSNVIYIGTKIEVDISCPKHKLFKQKPTTHLAGSGCTDCGKEHNIGTIDTFIKKQKVFMATNTITHV